MYQRPVTDIKGSMYNSIAGGIIVQIKPSVFHVKDNSQQLLMGKCTIRGSLQGITF